MTYETLFDVTTVAFFDSSVVPIIVIAAVFIAFGMWRLSYVDFNFFASYRAFLSTMMVAAGLFYFTMLVHYWMEHNSMQQAVANDEGLTWIEGSIRDHTITNQSRGDEMKRVESFRLGQTDFEFIQTAHEIRYFTNAADRAVQLNNGMRIRIAYLEDGKSRRILKLEIAR